MDDSFGAISGRNGIPFSPEIWYIRARRKNVGCLLMIKEAIAKLVEKVSLTEAEAEAAMREIMEGQATPAQIAAYITGLRMKGETVEEITGSARIMREKATKIRVNDPLTVDTCGTGGDRMNTFNVSTTAAFVVAGAGITVAKHGNRSVSSSCGSADVLKALGVRIDYPPRKDGGVPGVDRDRLPLCAVVSWGHETFVRPAPGNRGPDHF